MPAGGVYAVALEVCAGGFSYYRQITGSWVVAEKKEAV